MHSDALQMALPWTTIDVAPLMREENRTLTLFNRQSSGWQKKIACTISYRCPVPISTVTASACSTLCDASLSNVLVWLAYAATPTLPLQCVAHNHTPLYDVSLAIDRLSFYLRCGAKCFTGEPLCIVVFESLPSFPARWNCVSGDFRRLAHTPVKQASHAPSANTACQGPPLLQMNQKLDTLLRATAELKDDMTLILQNQQHIQNQLNEMHTRLNSAEVRRDGEFFL